MFTDPEKMNTGPKHWDPEHLHIVLAFFQASFDYHPYKLHRLDSGPPTSTTLNRDDALKVRAG
jgi:hypothetical protein